MTVRERIETFWNGERPDQIPYTIYWGEWFRAGGDRAEWQPLFDGGLGVTKHAHSVRSRTGDLAARTDTWQEDGAEIRRTTWTTSIGEIWADWVNGWHRKYWLETPEDYRVMTHVARHTTLEPAYDDYLAAEAALEPQEILLLGFGRTPIQTILVDYVGLENFGWHCYELLEPMMDLYEALEQQVIRRAELMAAGPGRYVALMENFTAETLPGTGGSRCRWWSRRCARRGGDGGTMREETAMIDWAEVLDPERLGLGEQVREIHWLERTNMDGDPLIEVRVILEPVPEEEWTWDLFGPVDRAIRSAVRNQTDEQFPIVRFFLPQDWDLFVSGEPLDDDEEPRYGVG